METTALSVGKSVLNGALGYAKSTFAEEVALQLGIQRDHAFVADELEMMRSFMMVAHDERDDNKVVKTWVNQVRDTAYDVEDSLQDFAVRLKKPSRWKVLRTLLERRRIAKQMKDLRAKVEDVSHRNVRYHLIKGSGSKAATAAEQSSVVAAAVFGVDDARRAAKQVNQRVDLVKLISEEGDNPKVITVWGTSGDIGLTSVVLAAYENADVQRKFPVRAWVRVMHPFSPKGFVQCLVNQFRADVAEDLFEEDQIEQDLAHKFNEYVKENRCLIVLNDLSTIEEWYQIKRSFRNSKKGSRIIVSTAQVEVASLCAGQESQVSELKQLSADQTLYAFYIKSSQKGDDSKTAQVSSSDAATTSKNEHTEGSGEIIKDQSKDTRELDRVVKKNFSRMRTRAGAFEESEIVGREKEISDLNKLISNHDKQQVQVISLYGMGGLGKTTLVDSVYQMQKLGERFKKCVSVTIMRPFHLVELLRSLVAQLYETSSMMEELMYRNADKNPLPTMGFEKLREELEWFLGAKSCLIILDDLSSTTEWDQIRSVLDSIDKTSTIVVTTREEDIANHCSGQQGNIRKLQVLEQEAACHLFSKKVFGNATDLAEKNPELVEEAYQILKKCGGLPLAIVTIGGFLANQPKTQMEWRKLNENISAELETNQELGKIRTILEKSYDGLPYHLKSCFLYLSIFPEDHTISRRRLVRRWAAEGYSIEMRGKPANEIADNYFMELKKRSMILPFQQSADSRKSFDSCKVHDLIREVSISKSMAENLVFILEEGCSMTTHGAVRHLAISSSWKGDQHEFESIVDLSRIRSLSLFGQWRPFYISDKMRFLRALDLEGTKGIVPHHLDHIGKLLHLRYLSFRGCDGICVLPDSLGNLRQLQTLDIRDTGIVPLPKTLIKLQRLQYIHAGSKLIFEGLTRSSMGWCFYYLILCLRISVAWCQPRFLGRDGFNRRDACTLASVMFPVFMVGLEEDGGVIVPRGIRKLKDLHTLRDVHVGSGTAVLQDIERLTRLHKLGVTGINKKNVPAFCSALSSLSKLESLSVKSSAGNTGLCGCLDGISSPPENLQSLKLYGNLKTLPKWIKELQHLVKLKLVNTRLSNNDTALKLLGSLPKLDILLLSCQCFEGEVLHFQSQQTEVAFENLRVLKLESAEWYEDEWNIKSARFAEGSMPNLEILQLQIKSNEFAFDISGLEFLSISEVQLTGRLGERELKNKIRDQLASNRRQPVLTVDDWLAGYN